MTVIPLFRSSAGYFKKNQPDTYASVFTRSTFFLIARRQLAIKNHTVVVIVVEHKKQRQRTEGSLSWRYCVISAVKGLLTHSYTLSPTQPNTNFTPFNDCHRSLLIALSDTHPLLLLLALSSTFIQTHFDPHLTTTLIAFT